MPEKSTVPRECKEDRLLGVHSRNVRKVGTRSTPISTGLEFAMNLNLIRITADTHGHAQFRPFSSDQARPRKFALQVRVVDGCGDQTGNAEQGFHEQHCD
jgi:hypothetical protein